MHGLWGWATGHVSQWVTNWFVMCGASRPTSKHCNGQAAITSLQTETHETWLRLGKASEGVTTTFKALRRVWHMFHSIFFDEKCGHVTPRWDIYN